MGLFVEVLLPIVSVFLIGFVLQKVKKLDVRSISSVSIYIFMPALVFQTFYDADLNGEFLTIVLFSVLLFISIIIVNKILALIFRWDQANESALILGTAFMNAGNYGSPVILFAFGETAFVFAIILMSVQTILMNFFGVYYASRGTSGIKTAIQSVFKMPATYAIILALLLQRFNVPIPENLAGIIDFLAVVTIPLMMVVLGMQLANISFKEFEVGRVIIGSTLRLIVSPLLALLIVMILPVSDLLAKVFIVIAAMPTAAVTTMYAVEFRVRPDLVSSITLVTTMSSVLTLSIILTLLM
ncbi:AEC family transporter [Bacillaceae bacterium W0354]